jgi:hypothetical protein
MYLKYPYNATGQGCAVSIVSVLGYSVTGIGPDWCTVAVQTTMLACGFKVTGCHSCVKDPGVVHCCATRPEPLLKL